MVKILRFDSMRFDLKASTLLFFVGNKMGLRVNLKESSNGIYETLSVDNYPKTTWFSYCFNDKTNGIKVELGE